MKLLLIHNFYQEPGGEDATFSLEKELLLSAGHRVAVYSRHNSEIAGYGFVPKATLGLRTTWAWDSLRELRRVLERERPDVAHFHNTFPLVSPAAYYACREAGVPVVQTLHNYRLACPAGTFFRDGRICEECLEQSLWRAVRHGCYRDSRGASAAASLMLASHRAIRTGTRMVDCYVVPSLFARSKCVEMGLPPEKLVVKPNFVAPDPGQRQGNGDYALYVGRISAEKGLNTLLAAWKLLEDRIPLRILGEGSLLASLKARNSNNGLSCVSFEGRKTPAETIAAIQGARFLVFPSEIYETFGRSIAEAFACGVPVLASRLGAMKEIVEDGCTGLHFKPGDAADLAEKVAGAWADPHRLEEMGRAARREYEAKYTAERNYSMLLEIYERALARRSVRARQGCQGARSASFQVLDVRVDAVQVPDVIEQMERWIAEGGNARYVAVTGMHGVMEAHHDPQFKMVLNAADLVVPDGMPLVWLGRSRGHSLARRVYGPELMLAFCEQTARHDYRHFFYGGEPGVPERLARILTQRFGIAVAGCYSPPYRALTESEEEEITGKIRSAAPDVLWVGLGTPKQERWMYEHGARLSVPVMVGVGAAFDLNSGRVRQAPVWMREGGLEWLFRLAQEPRRLWRRYLVYGPEFVLRVFAEAIGLKRARTHPETS